MKVAAALGLVWIIVSHAVSAQEVNFDWVSNTGGSGNASAWSTVVDAAGSTITIGTFSAAIDMDPGPAVYTLTAQGVADIFIVKYSSAGNFLWANRIGNHQAEDSKAIAIDGAGNIFLTGTFSGVVDFNPGAGAYNLTSAGSASAAFLLKLDNSGNFIWAKAIAQTVDGSTGDAITITASGDVYVLGSFKGVTDFDAGVTGYTITSNSPMQDVFIAKFAGDGAWLWAKSFSSSDAMLGYSIKADASGNVYSTGVFYGTADFDPGPGVYNLESNLIFLSQDIFISKLDANGTFVWAKQFVGESTETAYGLALDGAGNIYIGGEFDGEVDFDPGPATFSLQGHYPWASFLVKLTSDGNFIWAKYFGTPGGSVVQIKSVAIDVAGDIYFTGTFIGAIDFDPGSSNFTLTATGGYANIFIAKLKPDGTFGFAKHIGNNGFSIAYNISTDASRNVYVTGYFMGTHDFDPDQGVHNVTAGFGMSAYVLKLSRCLQATSAAITVSACDTYMLNNQTYSTSGVYTQYLTNAAGCDSIITLHITINRPKTRATSVTTCGTYTWEGNTYSGSGQYFVAYTGINGCDSTLILNLQIGEVKRTTNNISICEGDRYFAGGNNQSVSGTYYDTLTSCLGCDSIVTTVLAVRPLPFVNLGPDITLCEGIAVELSPGQFASYQWQDYTTGVTFTAASVGLYWVKVTDAGGCNATDSITIMGISPKPGSFLPAKDSICQYGTLQLKPIRDFQSYQWSTGSVMPSINIDRPGQYILEVEDYAGCYGNDTVNVYPKNCRTGVYFPTAFTPNDDGLNDNFRANVYGSLVRYRMQVYNRWGELIFQSTDPSRPWDGRMKGKKVASGTFVWMCSYQLAGDTPVQEKGIVTVIR